MVLEAGPEDHQPTPPELQLDFKRGPKVRIQKGRSLTLYLYHRRDELRGNIEENRKIRTRIQIPPGWLMTILVMTMRHNCDNHHKVQGNRKMW